jgi:DNA-binding MarR family transcriptional regulator
MAIHIKPGEALRLWRAIASATVEKGWHDMTFRQWTILMIIYLDPPPYTVRGLAARLKVTKPVITRALDTLGELDFLARRPDERDRRNVIIQRTAKGSLFMDEVADMIVAAGRDLA